MGYYIDDDKILLNEVQTRIKSSDLVPSRKIILENIDQVFKVLDEQGIKTLSDLRKQLKTPKKINEFSEKSGIAENYLTLLRREVESYFPKVFPVSELNYLPTKESEKLTDAGLQNTKKLYEALCEKEKLIKISRYYKINISFLEKVLNLTSLVRVQWVSPLFAYVLYEAGYISPQKIAKADAEELCSAVNKINARGKYFKGKIGLRDIKRLVNSAKYVGEKTT